MRKTRKTQEQRDRNLAWLVWDYRIELLIGEVASLWFWAITALSPAIWAPFSLLALVVLGSPWSAGCLELRGRAFPYPIPRLKVARRLRDSLHMASTRRRIQNAGHSCGLGQLHVSRVRPALPGELVDVRVPRGTTVDQLESKARAMAGCLHVSDVRVRHDRDDRSHAELVIVRRNAFDAMATMTWPLIEADRVDVRGPVPLGLDEFGKTVHTRLLSRNMILGGAPDSGKSAALRVIAAAAALDPTVKLWMMDAKTEGAEFVHWAPAAHRLIRGRKLEDAVEMFAELEARVEARGQEIVARGEVFVQPDMELDVLMIDELPQFMRVFETDNKKQAAAVSAIRSSIWKLIAVGRWAGMITVLSAQKPTADIVPSESRDLIDHKLALHCNTRAMSDAILGAGAGEESPANAVHIPSGQPGVGYYLGDRGVEKIRTFFISHQQALEIASRAAARNLDQELATLAD